MSGRANASAGGRAGAGALLGASSRMASRAGSRAASRTVSRARSTFMVEAMLLLACVLLLLAVTVSLFAFAAEASRAAGQLQEAADIAQNTAEEFVADPTGMPDVQTVGDYVVACDVDRETTEAGYMFHARVTVLRGDDEVCSLDASKYESVRDEGAGGQDFDPENPAGGGSSLREPLGSLPEETQPAQTMLAAQMQGAGHE